MLLFNIMIYTHAMSKLSKQNSTILKWCVSLLFVGWLVMHVQWAQVWQHVLHMQPVALLEYIVLVLIGMLLSAKKWNGVARYKGFSRTTGSCFRAYLTGSFINNFSPGFIGGDVYRTHWLGKIRESYSSAASTVVFDRFTGLFASALLALIFSFSMLGEIAQSSLWTVCVVMLSILVVGVVFWGFIWKQVSKSFVVQNIVGFLPQKIQRFLTEVQHYFQAEIMTPSIIYSILFAFIGVGCANLVLFSAFGADVPIIPFFAVIFLISILSSAPISINNIGVKEWTYYTFFTMIGMNPELAVTVALVSRFVQMSISFFALPEFLRRKELVSESKD